MKWVVLALTVLPIAAPAHAASFDCAKASTKVEYLICADHKLSELDEDLSDRYTAAVRDSSNSKAIKRHQLSWLKTRNDCGNAACVKVAYEKRLAELTWELRGSFALSEQERGQIAAQIMRGSDAILRAGPYSESDQTFCNGFVSDFQKQHGIDYIEPQLRTNNYEAPELVKLRAQCPNIKWAWMAPAKCDADALALWLKGFEGNPQAAHKKAEEMCATLFGADQLALYEINDPGHTEYVIYQSRTPNLTEDELDQMLRKPTAKELWGDQGAWNRRTNTVFNVFFTGAGYSAYDLSACNHGSIGSLGAGGVTSGDTLQGLVKYRGRFYAYSLTRYGSEDGMYVRSHIAPRAEYGLIVGGRNPLCHFDLSPRE